MDHLPKTMRGIRLTGHGGFDRLEFRDDLPVPSVGPTDVLIRVTAAGVNNTDINARIGWYSKGDHAAEDASWAGRPYAFPLIQGADVCGHVAAVGDRVDPSRLGERVLVEPCLVEADGKRLDPPWYLGSECAGGFADYVVVAARHAHRVDSGCSDVELASFPCSYSTAENLLTRSRVGASDRVLVTGASGGVGSAAVQLAKARGAEIFAVTRPDKAEALSALGADRILGRDEAVAANSIDVVIDLVGGPRWPALLEALRSGGRYAVSGAIAGAMVTLDLRTLYLKDLSLFGGTVLAPEVFPNLIRRIESRAIRPVVFKTFPLEDIAAAQTLFLEKRHIGKIVLTVADGPDANGATRP